MALVHQAPDWHEYRMDTHDPHRVLEPMAQEIQQVDAALQALCDAGLLAHSQYDKQLFLAHREAVAAHFDIPWTAITPRMQRLLYAINAIRQPETMVATGIFCGNTFISNAGAAVGPGSCYRARRMIGVEIVEKEAARAARNIRAIDPEGCAVIVAGDGISYLQAIDGTIDLLYLDANGGGGRGKSIYLDMLDAARHALTPGALVLAHNSVNAADSLADYLATVRDQAQFRESMNVFIDGEGLEVSLFEPSKREWDHD